MLHKKKIMTAALLIFLTGCSSPDKDVPKESKPEISVSVETVPAFTNPPETIESETWFSVEDLLLGLPFPPEEIAELPSDIRYIEVSGTVIDILSDSVDEAESRAGLYHDTDGNTLFLIAARANKGFDFDGEAYQTSEGNLFFIESNEEQGIQGVGSSSFFSGETDSVLYGGGISLGMKQSEVEAVYGEGTPYIYNGKTETFYKAEELDTILILAVIYSEENTAEEIYLFQY